MTVTLLSEWHRDGVPWHDAPKPRRRRHRHRVQSAYVTREEGEVDRCACGALQFADDPGWIDERRPRFR